MRGKSFSFGLAVVAVLLMVGIPAKADPMSSESYRIPQDVVSLGGNPSTSDSFFADDVIGEGLSGENLQSASYRGCIGFECYFAPYITFTVATGTSSPGTPGGTVDLGTLDTLAVKSSDGDTINSVFVTAATNAPSGSIVTVRDASGGLASTTVPTDKISSASATLAAGTDGFGLCVKSVSQAAGSPTSLAKVSPFDGSCDFDTNHAVGAVSTSAANILQSNGYLQEGAAEILVKAAVSVLIPAHSDYADTLTFIMTATY